jgi:hypothetical protein
MTLANRVLGRYKRAGASEFEDYINNPQPNQAFDRARDDARHESGSGGYSGTIAEKSSFKIRQLEPMTREQARKFIEQDIEKNDKYGPAFAVAIGEATKAKEQKATIRVAAVGESHARTAAEQQLTEKFAEPGSHVIVKTLKTTLVKEGKLPDMKIEKGGSEGFYFTGPGMAQTSNPKVVESHAAAIAEFKQHVQHFKPHEGDLFRIVKFKTTDTITIGDLTKSLHLYEVECMLTFEKPSNKIIGWIFYGLASS